MSARPQRYGKQPVNRRQKTIIHTLTAKLGMDDDAYRGLMQQMFGVSSSTGLSWREADDLITELRRKGGEVPPEVPVQERAPRRWSELDGRPGMATAAQCRMIEAMWAEVSRMPTADERERALWSFLRRIVGVDHFRFLKRWQVQKVVAAIEAMKFNSKEV